MPISAFTSEWLRYGLSTEPADRPSAEAVVSELYRLIGLPRPEFHWVSSPSAGFDAAVDLGHSVWPPMIGAPSELIADELFASRQRMDRRIAELDERVARQFRRSVRDSLHTTLFNGVAPAIRSMFPEGPHGIAWFGQQDAHRVAYYDAFRSEGLVRYSGKDNALLDLQAALVRSTGWWWAPGRTCVMADRPVALHTEPIPGAICNERRLHHQDAPAIEFADESAAYVVHGTIVPEWVIEGPTAELIAQERNVEVRRCAIERIGWDSYIEMAHLVPIDRCDDPGNSGHRLELYEPPSAWRTGSRLLIAVNGSDERDGQRRRYGLHVPAFITTALDAAGWTYGLSGRQYSQLSRRT